MRDKVSERLAQKRKEVMEKYPLKSRVAAEKWIYLQSHGYVSDRRTDKGLLIYKQGHPHIWGEIDWWGQVTWGSK